MSRRVDVLVVGGGIYGAAVAHEAVRRGASVLLVDRGDVAGGATSNSLKTAHGGLRYLQSLDLPRFYESVRERRRWLREAAPWVLPARFEMDPAGRKAAYLLLFRAGLLANDLLSAHRNRGVPSERQLPASRYPTWWDAVFDEPERIVFSLLRACAAGPGSLEVETYCAATELLRDGERVVGAMLADGTRVDCSHVFRCVGAHRQRERPVLAMNLVLPTLQLGTGATGIVLTHPDDGRNIFVLEWRGHSMVGTWNRDYPLEPRAPFALRSEWVLEMLRWLAPVHPRLAGLTRHDVKLAHAGLLPRAPEALGPEPASKRRIESQPGMSDVIGVKWTTAWGVADEAVSRVLGPLTAAQKAAWIPLSELAPEAPRSGEEAFRFAVESEWATRLDDVLLRRLGVAATGHPGLRRAEAASVLMQPLLDWSERERLDQLEAFHELPEFSGNVPD